MKAISLFASGGIGDLALKFNNIEILIANELLEDRCQVLSYNYPETEVIQGDIWEQKNKIIERAKFLLNGSDLDILYATPPCQGMSKNGRGTILNNIRKGIRPKLDERNLLIIPAMEIAKSLNPKTIILENVPEMADTIIETPSGEFKMILDYVQEELGLNYKGKGEIVEFADYGVPQKRQRLISIFSRIDTLKKHYEINNSYLPETTHSNNPAKTGKPRWISVRDVISHLPPIDSKSKDKAISKIEFHRVPVLDDEKYFWVSNTQLEKSAFDNQCIKCGYDKNTIHGSTFNKEGINRANISTPLRCEKCNSLLPRPWVIENGEYRIMKGFTSAYKRIKWDSPSNALTTNLSYACSDSKIHPEQNRVLSLYEAFIIHTVSDFDYRWVRKDGKKISDKTIREIIGESIPPRGLKVILKHLIDLIEGRKINRTNKKSETLLF